MPRASLNPFLDEASRLSLEGLSGRYLESGAVPVASSEHNAYGGIGAVACVVNDRIRSATAFLVGRFDTAVTVAHVFASGAHWLTPDQCFYASSGPSGQIWERVPLVSIKAQWQAEPASFGQPRSDLAVVRLATPAKWARRTMSFTRFAHTHAPVILVGFRADLAADALKRKSRGEVFPLPGNSGCVRFTHDVYSMGMSAGAPLIDIRDGVVLGLHTRLSPQASKGCGFRGNAMILMSDWLETTLRGAIAAGLPQQSDVSP